MASYKLNLETETRYKCPSLLWFYIMLLSFSIVTRYLWYLHKSPSCFVTLYLISWNQIRTNKIIIITTKISWEYYIYSSFRRLYIKSRDEFFWVLQWTYKQSSGCLLSSLIYIYGTKYITIYIIRIRKLHIPTTHSQFSNISVDHIVTTLTVLLQRNDVLTQVWIIRTRLTNISSIVLVLTRLPLVSV